MKAFEFNALVKDGNIKIPPELADKITENVRVILLAEEFSAEEKTPPEMAETAQEPQKPEKPRETPDEVKVQAALSALDAIEAPAVGNWYENAVFYHIYPLGYCGCPKDNDFSGVNPEKPILRVIKHIPEIKRLGFSAVYFGPVFESSRHGYDTADYLKIDSRLGTNEDFALVCKELRENGIKIVLDGVFNHVGRDFWAFKDVRANGLGSRYANWFHTRSGNSNYNDGFFYEGWEGHYELVRLNLQNPEVRAHIMNAVTKWREEFGIDGLRLDVAYCLDLNFLKELRAHCKSLSPGFWLMGETLHGDYNTWMNPEMLDSVTNYECYKGIYSSFNSLNMFEIAYSLNRQFGRENWCIYKGRRLYCFVDNHDVSRVASILTEPKHLAGVYTLLFTMPGIPGVYYGGEYGEKGDKKQGDDALRPEFNLDNYKDGELTGVIARLAKAHSALKPLYAGDYRQIALQNACYAFARSCGDETVFVLINADSKPVSFSLGASGNYADALGGGIHDVSKEITLPAYGSAVLFQAK